MSKLFERLYTAASRLPEENIQMNKDHFNFTKTKSHLPVWSFTRIPHLNNCLQLNNLLVFIKCCHSEGKVNGSLASFLCSFKKTDSIVHSHMVNEPLGSQGNLIT